jgi:hypothetical protein
MDTNKNANGRESNHKDEPHMDADESILIRRLRRLFLGALAVLGDKKVVSGPTVSIRSRHSRTPKRNLRNPPPQSLRRDRFCVICGSKLPFMVVHLRPSAVERFRFASIRVLIRVHSRLGFRFLFASIRGWFGVAVRHDDFNVGLVQRLEEINRRLGIGH